MIVCGVCGAHYLDETAEIEREALVRELDARRIEFDTLLDAVRRLIDRKRFEPVLVAGLKSEIEAMIGEEL